MVSTETLRRQKRESQARCRKLKKKFHKCIQCASPTTGNRTLCPRCMKMQELANIRYMKKNGLWDPVLGYEWEQRLHGNYIWLDDDDDWV